MQELTSDNSFEVDESNANLISKIVQVLEPSYSFRVPILAIQEKLVLEEGLNILEARSAINQSVRLGTVRATTQNRYYVRSV